MKRFFIELTLTDSCNCNCKYCFEGSHQCKNRDFDEEDRQLQLILNAVQQISDKTSEYEQLVISFWGGEPFLNTDFMYKVINATCMHDFVHYNYYSNGTLTEKYNDFVKQDFISKIRDRLRIQLSYDGEPIHEIMRGDNGKDVVKTADLLFMNDIKFQFKATLPYDMVKHLSKVWDTYYWLFLRYGNSVSYFPTLDTSCKDVKLMQDNLDEFVKQMKDIAKKEYVFVNRYGQHLMSWFNGRKCNCDINDSIFMHTDGNIYYCHGCPYKNDNNFAICSTKDVDDLMSVKQKKIDLSKLNKDCNKCIATFCASCHIEHLESDANVIDSWISCRSNNEKLCNYYKAFGKIDLLFDYALKYRKD